MRGFLQRFFYGRYGADELGRFLIVSYFVFFFLNRLPINWRIAMVFHYIGLVSLLLCLFRMMSRNIWKRQQENSWYLSKTRRIRSFFQFQQRRYRERKTYLYHRCPHCKAMVRLPRKKGKHTVCCPKCHVDFSLKIH